MGINFLEPLMLDALDSLMWPLCRVGGFMMAFVTFSGSAVPRNARALLALTVTVCFLPSIPAVDANLDAFSGLGIVTTISQVIIGAGLGFMTQYLIASFVLAGQAIAMQTGLGFASLVDPVSGTNAPVVGQFFTVLCTLVPRHIAQKTAIVVLTLCRSFNVRTIIASTSKEKKNWQIPAKTANHFGCMPSLHDFIR